MELQQGATTLSVGPETLLEFPALEKRGAPIDRIVQPRGNVFYNIGKREGRKLRIETPYLVGVVKGTQFNVAAQDDDHEFRYSKDCSKYDAADGSGSSTSGPAKSLRAIARPATFPFSRWKAPRRPRCRILRLELAPAASRIAERSGSSPCLEAGNDAGADPCASHRYQRFGIRRVRAR